MKVLALSEAELRRRLLGACAGADPHGTAEGLAEAVRAEAGALGVALRRVLADRVCALLRPAGAVPVERALDVMRRLEELGDLVPGPGGRVAAAPLRAVRAGPGHHLLLGGMASTALGVALGAAIAPAVLRRLRGDPAADEALAAAVSRLGGRVLSIESWAGLDRAPPADAAWLALLEERLRDPIEPVAAAEAVLSPLAGELERYVPGARRWRRDAAGPGPLLVRARHPFGWFAYAWLAAGPADPPRRAALRLGRDEARRTQFALDAGTGQPLVLQVAGQGDAVQLTIDALLPGAEYRFLLGFAERAAWEGLPVRYRLAEADLPRVSACLAQRLGIRVDPAPSEAP